MTEQVYWIWLNMALGKGSAAAGALLRTFGDAKRIFECEGAALRECKDISPETMDCLLRKDLAPAFEVAEYCVRHDIGILCREDSLYPDRLRLLQNAPLLLYYRGMLPNFDAKLCIGMVGTRKMSDYGARLAYRIAYEATIAGVQVVSGIAQGIDATVLRGVLDASGHPVSILANGIDIIYPKQNSELIQTIATCGTLLTEYEPHTQPQPDHYRVRNRLISGFCQATAVLEAPLGSGALITADHAVKQGRDLYVLPGNVGRMYAGNNRLLKNGAAAITRTLDLLEPYAALYTDSVYPERIGDGTYYANFHDPSGKTVFPSERDEPVEKEKITIRERLFPAAKLHSQPQEKADAAPDLSSLGQREKRIWDAIGEDILPTDVIAQKTGLSVGEVMGLCLMLCVKGLLSEQPGGRYAHTEPINQTENNTAK